MSTLRVEVELPRDLLAALNIPESDFGRRVREWVVLELFQEGEISSGKAAEILGLTKVLFLDLLAERNIPCLDANSQDLERELAAAEALMKSQS